MLYTTTSYPLNTLVFQIKSGQIGLPELQRPFVWSNTQVRDLFDSMYKGFPCGFLLLWQTGADLKGIGANSKDHVPLLAIVDGQQRLTSLYAVIEGVEVVRKDYTKERIRIAFDPLKEEFKVADAATEKDPAYVSDIAKIWAPGSNVFAIANAFLDGLRKHRPISEHQTSRIQQSISQLEGLKNYQFNALVLNAELPTVAEIFVRVNSKGVKLNNADFILTLLSVYWEEGRQQLEAFSKAAAGPPDGSPGPKNFYLAPTPDQMIRVIVAVGLKRAKLSDVYSALRGRVKFTGDIDPSSSAEAFAKLKKSIGPVLNVNRWLHFLSALPQAGYQSKDMIIASYAVLFAYAIYLIGIEDFHVDPQMMRQASAEFFFMAALTSRYSSTGETNFEADLASLGQSKSADDFLSRLRRFAELKLTEDFWKITLPESLATSGARTPAKMAYRASLAVLKARVLYSPITVESALNPAIVGSKATVEEHHLFSKAYLNSIGTVDKKEQNQIGNLALVEWPDNSKIGGTAPSNYAQGWESKLTDDDRRFHALPTGWWTLTYSEFLEQRRKLMADVVRSAWKQLRGDTKQNIVAPPTLAELLAAGESEGLEFKSTLRRNLRTGQNDERMELAVLKTVAAFLNAGGGTLLIGVDDGGEPLGLQSDGFASEDKMSLHLTNLIRDRIGELFLAFVHSTFEDCGEERILRVRSEKGPKPAWVRDGATQRFYMRAQGSTQELQGPSALEYIQSRFK